MDPVRTSQGSSETIPFGSKWSVRTRGSAGDDSLEQYADLICSGNWRPNLHDVERFGDEHDVHVRIAGDDRNVYLDLCDAHWRAVEVMSTDTKSRGHTHTGKLRRIFAARPAHYGPRCGTNHKPALHRMAS
jgi:hypothetical protein